MQAIISTDGTRISYTCAGEGSALLLVHGTSADHTRWDTVRGQIERHHRVYAMDRRGRGASGDSTNYTIEQEFDDVAALIDALGAEVNVFAHSYGALCALEAALRTEGIRRLVLYEPAFPIPAGQPLTSPELLTALRQLIDAGDRDGALELFLLDIVDIPAGQLAAMRADPAWPGRLAAVHTVAREQEAENEYVFVAERFAGMRTPTVLLTGGESPPIFARPTAVVAGALPAARVVVMPGQQHMAMTTAPDLFVRSLLVAL